ncbi:MAG: NAD-dependent dehydratase [Bacteroidetes bacterium]|nr:MAG: NAD-dependent dehydratase [Bacteroidota bacterium]
MKYVITGSAGHISKPLAEKLLEKDHDVTIIGRHPSGMAPLVAKGARAEIGSVYDLNFLKKAFAGADAVYTMVPPPDPTVTNWKASIQRVGNNYAEAIYDNKIKWVVNLSSVGAHLPTDAGPVNGLHFEEKALNELSDVSIRHLRPGYFYTNFLGTVGMARNLKIIGGNFGGPDLKMVITYPGDIADVAAEELNDMAFTGHTVLYLASDEKTTDEIAKIFGNAIGQPELRWVIFSDEQNYKGAVDAGLPEEVAKNYTEMGAAIRSGKFLEDYLKNRPSQFLKTKLEDFAPEYAAVYHKEEEEVHH